jgi:methyltransferase (TIGR00027 family)
VRDGRPSLTARWIAAHRDRLAGTRPSTPEGDTGAEHRLYEGMSRGFVLPGLAPTGLAERTRFIDDEVARAIGTHVGQIVLVGAGYDGRALRFGGGTTRWFELDFPATQSDKQRRLHDLGVTTDHVTYAGIDLMTGDLDRTLADAGHDAAQPTLFVCEGLLAYLPLEVNARLCETLRDRAAPGSVLAANFLVSPPRGPVAQALQKSVDTALSVAGEARRTEFRPDDPEKLLVVTGWQVVRTNRAAGHKLDKAAHVLLLAGEPKEVRLT